MSPQKTETEEYPALEDIRRSLAEVDKKREDETLSKEECEILELSAVALRDSERLKIVRLQKSAITDMEASVSSINSLAKEIRAKVTRMNKTPKSIDKLESTIKVVVKIVGALAKWQI